MIRLTKDSISKNRTGFFKRWRPKVGERILQRRKARRLRRMSRPVRFPRVRKIGNFFFKKLKLGRVFSFIFRSFITIWQSLWFRMVGVYAIMLLILLGIILGMLDSIAWRDISGIQNSSSIREQREADNNPLADLEIDLPIPVLPPSIEFEPDGNFTIQLDISSDPQISIIPVETAPVVEEETTAPIRYYLGGQYFYDAVRGEMSTAFIVVTMIVLVFGTIVFWQITRPLVQIRKASQAISRGDHSVRLKVKSRNELGRVANAFNEMAEEIEKQDQMRKRMVADVAHELRTPLTVMKSNLEAMLDGILEPSSEELSELHDEVGRLNRMIEDLRLLSLADAGELPIIKQPVDIRQLLGTIVTRYTALAESNSIKLAYDDAAKPLVIYADSDKLQQAIRNLLENALHYTPQGGKVRVTAVQDQAFAKISIIDTGSGISPEEISNLFDRFWRGDRSRNRHSGGSGLGLSIVQQIAELHGGSVNVVSPDGAGAIFTIKLPLSSKHSKVPTKKKKWLRINPQAQE